MGRTKELIGYQVDIKHYFGSYDSVYVGKEDYPEWEAPSNYKEIGAHAVYEQPHNGDFHALETYSADIPMLEKIITHK